MGIGQRTRVVADASVRGGANPSLGGGVGESRPGVAVVNNMLAQPVTSMGIQHGNDLLACDLRWKIHPMYLDPFHMTS